MRYAYNWKVIEYPNGSIQIRHYNMPVTRVVTDDMLGYETKPFGCDDLIINPFDYQPVNEVNDFSENTDSDSLSDVDYSYRNYNRAKQQIFTYARCVMWEYFVTFTYAPDKVSDKTSYEECSSKIRKWLNNQRRVAPDLQYLVIPELHKDGKSWHFHGLFANTGGMVFDDSGKVDKEKRPIFNVAKWKYGFTTATKVGDIHKVSKYIGKYITKTLCDVTKGKKRYYVSHNIDLPKQSIFFLDNEWDEDNVIGTIAGRFGKEISHISQYGTSETFTQVTYYELI